LGWEWGRLGAGDRESPGERRGACLGWVITAGGLVCWRKLRVCSGAR
jgi:hypothetical protein